MMRWLLSAVLVLLVATAVAGYLKWQEYLDTPLNLPQEARYEIEAGASLGSVALDLGAREWLKRPAWFVWYARSRGEASQIRAGEYRLAADTTPRTLLARFISGDVLQHSFTIIEGTTFTDVRRALASHEIIKQTISAMTDAEVMAALGHKDEHPEGRFLPETYYFTRGESDLDVLRRAYDLQQQTLDRMWPERDPDIPLKTPYEALIMASIIEKETALDTERGQISGVFARRLQTGMRLQSDPTVIYGVGAAYDGNIRRRDLNADTPYNTYTRGGLPPTPIAMPGRASIAAALHPQEGDALYFVASGDPDGSHYFSATLDEHNEAVNRYLQKLRNRP